MNQRLIALVAILATGIAAALACAGDEQPLVSTVAPPPAESLPPAAEFAYVGPEGWVWVASADGSTPDFPWFTQGRSVRVAGWSADGRCLAQVGSDGSLQLFDRDGRDSRVIEGSTGQVLDARWAGFGDLLLYRWTATEEATIAPQPDAEYRLARLDGSPPVSFGDHYPSISPDGSHAAYFVPTDEPAETLEPLHHDHNRLVIVDLATGDEQQLVRGALLDAWSPDGRLISYWKENVGGTAIVGDMAAVDIDTGRVYELGRFTDDETPQWAPTTSEEIFHNIRIDLAIGTVAELFPRPGALLAWSPDAKKAAIIEGDWSNSPRTLVLWDRLSRARTVLNTSMDFISHPYAPGYRGGWSHDARYLAFTLASNENAWPVFVADTATGGVAQVHLTPVSDVWGISFSADGHWLMVAAQHEDGTRWIIVATVDASSVVRELQGVGLGDGGGASAWRRSS